MGRPVARDRRAFSGDEDALDDLPIGVVILVEREVVRINDGWTALTGMDWQQSVGAGWLQGIDPADRTTALDLVTPDHADQLRVGELRVRSADGSGEAVWVHARSRIVAHDADAGQLTCVLTLTEIDARKAHELRLLHRATHDAATGLANRDGLLAALEAEGDQSLAVLFIDLDRFKDVNDLHGHAFGDLVLATVARRLESLLRPNDTVARLGGDEFAVLCHGVGQHADAVHLAERVIRGLSAPLMLAGRTVRIGASVGIALAGAERSVDELLDRADRAMYRAKLAGGSQWAVVDETSAHATAATGGPDRSAGNDSAGNDVVIPEEDVHHVQASLAATEHEVLHIVSGAHPDERSAEVVRMLFEQLWSVVAEAVPNDATGKAS